MNRAVRFAAIGGLLVCGVFAPQGVSQAQVSNTWSSAGQMTQARSGAAAVRLTDGQILITGGTDGSGIPQAAAEVYNPATGAFTALPAMNVPRANHAAIVLLTGDVLVTGGSTTGGGYSDSAEIFSASSQQWTLLSSSIGTGLAGHTMAELSDGNILIAGGVSTTKVAGSIVLFNLADKTFTSIAALLTPRTGAVAAATPDGRVLIAGGADMNGAALASTEIFTYSNDTMTGTVSAGPTMTSPRVGATATATYDGVAIIGGNNGQNDLGTAEIFSQWTNTLRVVSGGVPRSGHFAALLPNNGSVLVIGGTGGTAVDLLEPWANNKAGAFFAASPLLVNQDGGFASPSSLGSLLAAGGMGSYASAAELYSFPTISTDRSEYPPGTLVEMTGAGFQPFEEVALHLHEWVNQSTEDDPDATAAADSFGSFAYNGYAPDSNDVGARYHLTAVGLSSGYQAQTIFGDSITSIVFTSAPLDQAAGACGTITLAVGHTGTTYGTITLSDGIFGLGPGAFYSDPGCTTAITSIAGAATVTFYYKNNTVGTDTVTVGTLFILVCLTNCTSQTETIYQAPTKLVFLVSPGGGTPGLAWAQQPVVTVQNGNTVTPSSAPITLAISGSSPAGGTLHCTSNPSNATSGVAAFTGCYISTTTVSSSCYYLTATSPNLTTATSGCFYITTAASTTNSTVYITSAGPTATTASVLDDGTTTATITVTLKDGSSNALANKTVTLTAGGGDSFIAATGTTPGITDSSGQATFTVTDTHAQAVTYTATDTTDGVTLTTHTVTVTFIPGTPTSGNSTVVANPTSVLNNGTAYSTITVTLEDSTGNPVVASKNVLLKAGSGNSLINGVLGTTGANVATNSSGVATFTVTDLTAQAVTYTAKDTTDNVTVTQTASVTFGATPIVLAWTTAPPATPQADGNTFQVAAAVTPPPTGTATYSYSVAGGCSITGTTVTMTSGTIACVVTATVTITGTGAGTDSISATVTAALATSTVTINCSTSPPVVYNGSAWTPCAAYVTGANGLNQPLTVTYTNNINAGQATASASFAGDANNAAGSNSVNFTIAQLPSTVTLICPGTEVYNGTAWTPCTATATGAGLNQSVTPTYSSDNIDAGTVTVTATYGGSTGNYSLGSATTTFTIVPASSTVTISCGPGPGPWSYVYTGLVQTPCTATATSTVPPLSTTPVALTVTYTNNTNVGTATASATYAATTNYSASANQANFTITQASSATVSITCPATVSFNGGAQNVCTASITPVGESQQSVAVVYTPQNTNVGPVTATATYPGDTNNATASKTTTFNIVAAGVTATAGSLNGVYTGLAQSPAACQVTGSYIGSLTCTNDPTTEGPGVGSGTGTILPVVSAGSGDLVTNYAITAVNGSWAITLAPSTVTSVSCPASVTYTGVALTPTCTAVVTGVGTGAGGVTQTVTWSYTNNINAGTATATATYAGDANHAGSSGSTTFTIAPATSTVTVSCSPGTFGYTGTAQTPCTATVTGIGTGVTQGVTWTYTNNTNVSVAPATATAVATYPGDSNHAGSSSTTATFIIAPAPVTAKAGSYSGVYNGSTQSTLAPSCVVTGAYTGTLACVNSPSPEGPGVGSGTLTPVVSAGNSDSVTNYNITSVNGTWSITPAAPALLSMTCTGVTYTGNAQSPQSSCTGTATGVSGGTTPTGTWSFSPSETAAGTHTVTGTFTASAGGNYQSGTATGPWVIAPAPSTVTVSCSPGTFGYTGAPLTPCTASVAGIGTGVTQGVTWTYTNNTNVGVNTATATANYPGDLNHAPGSGSATFSIAQGSATLSLTCTEVTYDGNPHSCTGSATPAAATGTWTYNPGPETNAGSYPETGTFTSTNPNFQSGTAKATLTIDPAPSTVLVTCNPTSVVYTGAAQTPCTATVTGVGGLNVSEPSTSLSFSNNVIVGTAKATYNYAGDSNHAGSSGSANFTITQATPIVTLTCPASVFYDGAAQTPCSATATDATTGLSQTLTVTYGNNTNVGTATASANFTDPNYVTTTKSTTFLITITAVVATAGSYSALYDGLSHSPSACAMTGAYTGTLTCTNNPSSVGPGVGSGTVTPTYTGNSNFTITPVDGNWSITQASSSVTLFCPPSAVYTGSAVTPCGTTATVTGANLNQSVAVVYTNNTNVGTATATATYNGDANHTGSSNSQTFTIVLGTGTPTVTTVTCSPTSVVYTGAALTPCTATVTGGGAGGLNQSLPVTYTNNINAGTATASASYAGNGTYSASSNLTTFTITAAPVTATAGSYSGAYDGNSHSPSACAVTGAYTGGLTCTDNPSTVGPAAGSGTVTPTVSGGTLTNFAITAVNGSWSITPATSTVLVTCPTSPVVYNGVAQSPCSATVTGAGNFSLPLAVTYTPQNTNVGTVTATASFAGNATYGASNGTASFTITAAPVTATAGSYSGVADGNSHSPSACAVTGAYTGGLTCTDSPSSVGPAAGSGTVTPVVTGNTQGNFTVIAVDGTWTITSASSTPTVTTVSCPTSAAYTGAALTPCTATVTGTGLTGPQTVTWTYTNNTNAGTATASATYAGNATYGASTGSQNFTITQAVATVTLSNLTQAYTGSPLPVTVTTNPTGLSVTVLYSSASYPSTTTAPTAVGSYTVTATVVNPNYTGSATGTLVISTSSAGLTFTLALRSGMPEPSPYGTMVYFDLTLSGTPCPTGTLQFYVDGTASGTPVALNASSCASPATFQTATLDPGSHSVYAVYSGDTQYAGGTSNTVTHGVTADTTAVALAASATTVNVGQPVTFTATVTPSGSVDPSAQPPAGTVQFYDGTTPLGAPVTLSATSPYTAVFPTSSLAVGSHSISATYTSSDGEYTTASSSAVTVTVTTGVIAPTITWANPANIVYGTALSATQLDATATDATNGNIPVPGTFAYTPPAGTVLPVGTVNLSVTFTPTDTTTYSTQTATVTLTVTAATGTLSLTCTEVPYDGNPHSCVGAAIGVDGKTAVNGSWSYTPASETAVGSYPVTGTFISTDPDYQGGTATGTLKIDAAAPTLSLTCTEVPYDGNPHSCTGTATGAGGAAVAGSWSYAPASETAAGSYPVTGTFTSTDPDYQGGTATGTLKIDPTAVTLTLTCTEVTYDGNPHSCTGTATGAGGAAVAGSWSYAPASETAAGSYPVTGTFTSTNPDYQSGTATGTLKIDPTPVTATAGSYSAVDDGSAHSPSQCLVTGAYTGSLTCTNNPSSVGPGTGSGTVTPTVSGGTLTNFAITLVNGSWSITQGSGSGTPTVTTVSCPTSVAYTGAALTPCTATVTGGGAGGLNQSLTSSIIYANNTNAGTASASASFAGNSTYAASSNSTTFTITQAPATVLLSNLAQNFTGSPLPVTVTTNPTGLSVTVLYSSASYPSTTTAPTAVGSYTVTATVANPNYSGMATGTLVISPSSAGLTFTLALRSGMPEPSPYGTMVYFDLTLGGTPCPTGTVQFYVDGTASGTPVTLDGSSCSSKVTFQIATLDPGSHSVYAVYSGDTNYTGGTSNTVPHGVTADTTAVALAASATTVNVGQPVTFTATVTPTASVDPTAHSPAGTVEFFDGTTSLGTITLSTTSPYTAAFTTSTLAAGSHSISATYTSSDGEFTTATSSAISVLVVAGGSGKIAPTINWANPANIVYGTPLSATQLNATATNATGTVTVAGTFAYTPPAGTVLPVGTVNLSVTFTPTDTTTYSTQTATVTLTVTAATGTLSLTCTEVPYDGNPHSCVGAAIGVDGKTAVKGSWNYTPASETAVGSYPVTGTFTSTDPDYQGGTATGTLKIDAAPVTATAGSYSGAYDGQSHSPSACAVTGAYTGSLVCTNNPSTVGPTAGSGTVTPTVSGDTLTNYAITAVNGSWSITQPSSTVTLTCPASVVYNGSALTPCTATATGAGGLNQSLTVTYTNNTNVGTATASASFAGDANHSASSNSAKFTIAQAGTTTTLTSSSSSVTPGQGVTLTATVVSVTAGTPTGSVAFYNGSALLGTVPLTAGTATISTSSLTVGAINVLNAVYSGDSNFTTSQSSTSVTVAPLDFTLVVSGPANLTVLPGGVATYQVTLNPLYGNYPGPVSFTASGLPTGATATFNPSTIATNGGNQTVTVTILTPAVAQQASPPIGRRLAPLTLALLLFPLLGVGRLRRQGRRLSRLTSLVLLLGCTLAGAMMTGCGSSSGSGFFTQAQKNYTINLTATSGNMQHAATVTLVVE